MTQDPNPLFIAFDLEMNKPSGKIIQIGAVVGNILTKEVIKEFSVYVNPNEALDGYIIDLTGITQSEVDSGVSLEEAYLQLSEFSTSNKANINPITWGGGDSAVLLEQLGGLGKFVGYKEPLHPWIFGRRWIDAKTLYVTHRAINNKHISGGLAKAMTKFGLKFSGKKHNAVHDARNTFIFYCRLAEEFKGL